MAAIVLLGAFSYYMAWREFGGALQMALVSILIGRLARWRQRLLARKREELARAIEAHEAMLDKAFS